MRICIDSSVWIPGLQTNASDSAHLLDAIGPSLPVIIPRLIAREVSRNLTTTEQIRRFYRLFAGHEFAFIVDEPVPGYLVDKYVSLGLSAKADAFIGAFAEWMHVTHLVSANRHFLRALSTDAFHVLTPSEFLDQYSSGSP